MKVKVARPINMSIDEAQLFEPNLSYELPKLQAKKIKNAFVTNSGLVCGRKGLIKECYHDMPGEYEERLNEASHYYHDANDNAENLIILDDDETYLLIHHTWHNNYYHWLAETLLRLWMVKDQSHQMILLLPMRNQMSDFALKSLQPFTFKDVLHIPKGKSVLVRNLCMPQLKPIMASYNPVALNDLRVIYTDYINREKNANIDLGDRVYISRKFSRRRKIANEDQVTEVMRQYGFNIIYNENYSFFEQVSIYAKAKYVVGIHGAGLTNMLFMPPSASVFEFHKRQTNATDQHSLIFWYMADALGIAYYHQVCEPTNAEDDFFTADFVVDIDLLKANLDLMLGE